MRLETERKILFQWCNVLERGEQPTLLNIEFNVEEFTEYVEHCHNLPEDILEESKGRN